MNPAMRSWVIVVSFVLLVSSSAILAQDTDTGSTETNEFAICHLCGHVRTDDHYDIQYLRDDPAYIASVNGSDERPAEHIQLARRSSNWNASVTDTDTLSATDTSTDSATATDTDTDTDTATETETDSSATATSPVTTASGSSAGSGSASGTRSQSGSSTGTGTSASASASSTGKGNGAAAFGPAGGLEGAIALVGGIVVGGLML
ncbi:hypothetical protein LXA43DRAFT_1097941 [Ganoderma leucocontextum]|nr:hypothetical protein LXA43DRAFT_1097941 [Ganoderma leucocontextum]